MGGFRLNGCGATDHYKKVKSLGTHLCPRCKKAAEFFLEEAKFKVDIFFIPTVTLKSSYVVMCSKCGQGEYCSDQWAVNLINSTEPLSVIFESQVQQPVQVQASEQSTPSVPETITYAPHENTMRQPIPKKNTSPSFFKCSHCGVTQLREGAFCSFCGKPAPEDPLIVRNTEQNIGISAAISVCPVCRNGLASDKKFCANCGHPMEVQSPPKRVCPECGSKIEGNAIFCMECGVKL